MTKRMEERIEKVREETRREDARTFATVLLLDGNMSHEKIANISGLPIEEVNLLALALKKSA